MSDEAPVRAKLPYGDTRSAMARASGARPFKPYVYSGTGKDIYRGVPGSLDDVRRQIARREESAPDPEPDPEWYRERAAEDEEAAAAVTGGIAPVVLVPAPAPVLTLMPGTAPGGDELAGTVAARDRWHAALGAVNAAPEPVLAAPPPVTAVRRCRACGYLTTAAGHKVACDG